MSLPIYNNETTLTEFLVYFMTSNENKLKFPDLIDRYNSAKDVWITINKTT